MLELHTLEARDNAMLDVSLGPHSGYTGDEVRRQIGLALDDAVAALDHRRIPYSSLRTALTPQVGKKEIAIIFDSAVMDGWYGGEAADAILPLLERAGNHSILSGDIIWKDIDSAILALNDGAIFWRTVSVADAGQLYCIYVNNLSEGSFNALVTGMKKARGAIGYADCTYSSLLKSILATCVGTRYVKIGARFLNSHPYDCDFDTNDNTPGWPLEDHRYSYLSVDDMSFDLFLQYKIECDFAPYAFNDGHFSMVAATGVWRDPREIPISVDQAKRGYLNREKHGSMARAGLIALTNEELATQIQERLARSYIFSLKWNSELDYSTFATVVEFEHEGHRTRLRAVLKYEDETLGLVSLFG